MNAHDAGVTSGSSDAGEWNAKYAKRTGAWSGEPNELLVAEVAGLAAGRALDMACGEGADAVWLALNGWTVTAVDLSQVAIDRNRTILLPPEVAARITWLQADIATWSPPHARSISLACSSCIPQPRFGSACFVNSQPPWRRPARC